jgi:hypothetical protein
VFENRVLTIFGLKKDEMMGGWRNLHKTELHSLPSIIRIMKLRMRWMGHVVQIGHKRNAYRLLVGKPEEGV